MEAVDEPEVSTLLIIPELSLLLITVLEILKLCNELNGFLVSEAVLNLRSISKRYEIIGKLHGLTNGSFQEVSILTQYTSYYEFNLH